MLRAMDFTLKARWSHFLRCVFSILLVLGVSVGFSAGASASTASDSFIFRVHRDFLDREPSEDEYTWWNAFLGANTRSQMMTSIFQSDEFELLWTAMVNGLYLGWVDATSPEFTGQIEALHSSHNYLATEVSVLAGLSYWELSGETNQGFVEALYRSLLAREADSGGKSYWTGQLAGGASRGSVVNALARSGESANLRVKGVGSPSSCPATDLLVDGAVTAGSYCIILDRLADSSGSSYWVGQMTGSGQLPGLWVSLAASNEYYGMA